MMTKKSHNKCNHDDDDNPTRNVTTTTINTNNKDTDNTGGRDFELTPQGSKQTHDTVDDDDDDENAENDSDENNNIDNDNESINWNDLYWRIEKLRLEEQNIKHFLKAKPKFLPYHECRRWVQAFGKRWVNEKEWYEWIDMGEKRNPYIPSRPDEYYKSLGCWISWDHFLLQDYNDKDDVNDSNEKI